VVGPRRLLTTTVSVSHRCRPGRRVNSFDMRQNTLDMLSFRHSSMPPRGSAYSISGGERVFLIHVRRSPGKGTTGGDGEHTEHHRSGKACELQPGIGRGKRRVRQLRTNWKTKFWREFPGRVNGDRVYSLPNSKHQFEFVKGRPSCYAGSLWHLRLIRSAATSDPETVTRAAGHGRSFTMAHGIDSIQSQLR
jgi:hypothetical protein